jgi:hypothetical protein
MTTTSETSGGVVLLDVLADDGEVDRRILARLGHPVLMCEGPEVRGWSPRFRRADQPVRHHPPPR